MHFNEMSTKSRQLGLTLVVAALGLSAVLLGRGDDFSLVLSAGSVPIKINVAVLIILASALGMYGVQRLDLGVYHQMLRGCGFSDHSGVIHRTSGDSDRRCQP